MNRFVIVSSILFLVFAVRGQDIPLSRELEFPQHTVVGKLQNGFEYFIKQNNHPKESIELRLCLRVGSTQEKNGEEGIAHFIEHLAFEGAKNFPKNEAVKYWESLGAKFGITINAQTGYDRTIYTLTIPSEKTVYLDKTLEIFVDWLTALNLTKEAIIKQKGIITEEIASFQKPTDLHTIKRGVCPQLKRLPVGTQSQINQLTQKQIRDFYQKWYTPQNAALIIVGNVNTKTTEQTVKKLFGALKKGKYTVHNQQIPYPNEPLFLSVPDTLQTEAKLSWLYPYEYKSVRTQKDLLEKYKTLFAVKLMKHRLSKEAMRFSRYWYLQRTGLFEFSVSDKIAVNTSFTNGFERVVGLQNNGISQEEFEDLFTSFLDEIELTEDEYDSPTWAEEFVEMFLFNEKKLTAPQDKKQLRKLLEKIPWEEWNKILKEVFTFNRPELIIYKYNPKKHPKITIEEVQKWHRSAAQNPNTGKVASIEETEKTIPIPQSLDASIPFHPNMIAKEQFYGNVGIHAIELSNGAKLYLKPTKEDNRLNLNFIFRGGLSLLPEDKFYEMEDLISYVELGGTQNLTSEKFGDLLLQEEMTFVNTNENYFHGAMAAAPLNKVNVLCNLAIQKLLYPELCYKDFEEIKQEEIDAFNNAKVHKKTPLQQMNFRLEELKGNVFKGTDKEKTLQDIEQCNLDSLYAFYQKKYLSAANMICVATGSFQIDSVKKQLVGMLSKLPNYKLNKKEKVQDFSFKKNPIKEQIAQDTTKRLHYNIMYYGKYKNSLRNQLTLKLMRDALRGRLLLELREKNNWVYSPYIDLHFREVPFPAFFFTINGTTETKYCKKIEEAVSKIIASLKNKAIPKNELEQMKRSFLLTKQEYLSDYNSSQWRDYLQTSFETGVSLEEINNYEKILHSITVDDILLFFQKLVTEKQKKYLYVGNCNTIN